MKNRESISTIKAQLATIETDQDPRLPIWQRDPRKGVQSALSSWQKRQEKKALAAMKFQEMLFFENKARKLGYQAIAGIDEVGRGPLAGPVVAAAVILPASFGLLGINDSKQLSLAKREELFEQIQTQALSIGLGIIDQEIIDQVNIYEATKLAMQQAIEQLAIRPDFLLIDAMKLANGIPQENLIKGDARSVSIAAASIIAKVSRDRMMIDLSKLYPGYGFEKNAGYGTPDHLSGLAQQGVTPIHRKTFAPVKKYL